MARKKQSNNPMTWLVILTLIGLAVVFGVSQFSTIGGLTVTSVTAPNVLSNDADLTSLNWLISTRLGGSEQVVYTIQPGELESLSGTASEKPFKISASTIRETVEYRINAQSDFRIYKYYVTDIIDANQNCNIINGAEVVSENIFQRTLFSDKKFCILRVWEGRYGTLSNPTIKFEADLQISNGEEIYTRTISSSTRSVEFKNPQNQLLATASWPGSLVTGNPPPSLPPIGILSTDNSNRWALISQAKFTQYQIAQNGFETKSKTIGNGVTIYTEFERIQDSLKKENILLNSQRTSTVYNYDPVSTQYNLVNPTSVSDARMVYTIKPQLTVPEINWWIRADWIGVERLVGMPQIVSISSQKFGNSEQGMITLNVKNVGGDGAFVAMLESCQNFKQTYVNTPLVFKAGQSQVMEVYVDAGSRNIDTTATCTVRVYDNARPTNYDRRSVTLNFEATKVCTPGQYSADQEENAIYRCDADGNGLSLIKQCATNENVKFTGSGSTGGFECVAQEPGTPPIKGNFSWILFTITLLGSGILAGYVYTITRGVSHGFKIALAIGAFILAFIIIPTIVNFVIGLFTVGTYVPFFSVIPI